MPTTATTLPVDLSLVNLLAGLAAWSGKHYCYPSQDKLCELSRKFADRSLSRRTLNRHLRRLEDDRWIKRLRRHRNERGRGMVFHSTLYSFTRRSVRYLQTLAQATAQWLKKAKLPREGGPCATSGTISTPTGLNYMRPAPKATGPPPQKGSATQFVADATEILRKK